MLITMLKVRIPSKIDVDKSVDNWRYFPHFPLTNVENRYVHSLSTGFQQWDVDNQSGCSVRRDWMTSYQTIIFQT